MFMYYINTMSGLFGYFYDIPKQGVHMTKNSDFSNKCCVNKLCKDFGIKGKNNIGTRGTYGKSNKVLLYCRTCGKRFSLTHGTALFGMSTPPEIIGQVVHHAAEGCGVRATARLLGMDKNTVNRIILNSGKHCEAVKDELLQSLGLKEVQLDELWSFVKKKMEKRAMARQGRKAKIGYGQQ